MKLFEKFQPLAVAREELAAFGTLPIGVVTERIDSATEGWIDGRRVILAGTNNYLGLTFDPECVAAAQRAVAEQGTGTTGSRMANGSYAGHVALERELAEFYGVPSAVVFSTGFLATMGVVSTLAGQGDTILLDADCHASIYEGTRLSGAEVVRFRHNDPADLEKRLRRLGERAERTLIVVEGIYSMLGDRAPLAEIAAVKRALGGCLLVDEAHSLGVLGATGRGVCEEAGVEADVDLVVGTFSKSLGSVGGFCVSRHPELDLMRFAVRSYVFTASPAPSVVASTRVALRILRERAELREQLWRNVHHLYGGLAAAGFRLGPQPSPVIAVEVGSREQALLWWHDLLARGVYVNLILPPATPTGACLLRCSLSAAHTPAQIDAILSAFLDLRPMAAAGGPAGAA
ncbi:MAG: aminotransferase class I/II-fold pyridoxal phosphate-dependent enzyme [Gammaproteobacteria bacterium]|jgi:8-amino-7-oxononanoate synthase|nr:aminotransferase class I/II-fold pyridoxal phosphate-dependent enzyme [Gammaproteobacteria bacterium]